MSDLIVSRPRPLRNNDPVMGFDCGVEQLNRFLQQYALQNQQGEAARTYVAFAEDRIAGYYTLAYGAVEHAVAPERLKKGLARHPVPIMLLARLAVDRSHRGKGLGADLLRDAALRALAAAEIAGLRALLVQAKDESAASFYRHFGFEAFVNVPDTLMILTSELRKTAGRPRRA